MSKKCHLERIEAKRAEELGELKNKVFILTLMYTLHADYHVQVGGKVVILTLMYILQGDYDVIQVPFYCVCQDEGCNGEKEEAHHDDDGVSQGNSQAASICATIVAVALLLLH